MTLTESPGVFRVGSRIWFDLILISHLVFLLMFFCPDLIIQYPIHIVMIEITSALQNPSKKREKASLPDEVIESGPSPSRQNQLAKAAYAKNNRLSPSKKKPIVFIIDELFFTAFILTLKMVYSYYQCRTV